MMRRALALAVALALAPALPASAGGIVAASVGTASAQVLAAATGVGRRYLLIDNESATATIACTFDGAAALNTAGSWTIAPGGRLALGVGYGVSFSDSLNCIASADGTPATILWE
jgi:hypothetical protein